MRMATATATAKARADKTRALGAQRSEVSRLTTYEWVALDKRGKRMKGDMPAKNASLVKAELRRQGMNPQTVRERAKPLFGASGSKIKPGDVAIFSRQIATMMASGVPMVQSFDIIADGQKNVRFKNVLLDVKQNIEGGASLHEALGRYPVQFDELYCNLVHAGETSGVLDTVLDTVATYKERTEAIKKKIKKALFYPMMVLAVVFIVILIMLLFVVPVFAKTFQDAGAEGDAQRAGEAGDGGVAHDIAHHRHLQRDAIQEMGELRRAALADHDAGDAADHDAHHDVPVVLHELRGIDQELGRRGQLRASVLEGLGEHRHHEQKHDQDDDEHHR
jgi:hypothetical protein